MAHFVTLHDGERRKPANAMRICRIAADFDSPAIRGSVRQRGSVNLVLDTHVFLWWDRQDLIADPANQVFVSAASILEIIMKRRLKNLDFHGSAVAAIGANGFHELAILPKTRRMPAPLPGGTATRSTGCWWRRRGTRPAPWEPSM